MVNKKFPSPSEESEVLEEDSLISSLLKLD